MNPLVPIITLLFMLGLACKSEAKYHEDMDWYVMTAHVYPLQGLHLRIVSHNAITVFCETHSKNGMPLAAGLVELTPMVTNVILQTPRTNLIWDYSCSVVDFD